MRERGVEGRGPTPIRSQRLPARFALLRRPLCRPLRRPAPRPKRTWTWLAIDHRRLLRAARRSLVPRARSASYLRLRALRSRGAGSSALRMSRTAATTTAAGAPSLTRLAPTEPRASRGCLLLAARSLPLSHPDGLQFYGGFLPATPPSSTLRRAGGALPACMRRACMRRGRMYLLEYAACAL